MRILFSFPSQLLQLSLTLSNFLQLSKLFLTFLTSHNDYILRTAIQELFKSTKITFPSIFIFLILHYRLEGNFARCRYEVRLRMESSKPPEKMQCKRAMLIPIGFLVREGLIKYRVTEAAGLIQERRHPCLLTGINILSCLNSKKPFINLTYTQAQKGLKALLCLFLSYIPRISPFHHFLDSEKSLF